MKFYSIVSNINYEIIPTDWEYIGPNHRRKVPGISARFHDHMFDTKAQAVTQGWDEKTRELVEDYLIQHENFNTQWLQVVPESESEQRAKNFKQSGTCISRTVSDEGVIDCDQDAMKDSFYCKRHAPAPAEVST